MATCKECMEPLLIEVDNYETEGPVSSSQAALFTYTIPDDLKLNNCGCHFHWQCLLDRSLEIITSLNCPSCGQGIASQQPGEPSSNESSKVMVLVCYVNEGGLQSDLDMMPMLTEEAYLVSNPSTRPARAFLTMCGEGSPEDIVQLLQDLGDGEDPDTMRPSDVVLYQDPLSNMISGLHVAVSASRLDIFYLLLWLASKISIGDLPQQAVQIATASKVHRMGDANDVDIRSLRDAGGRTAAAIAVHVGGDVSALASSGLL